MRQDIGMSLILSTIDSTFSAPFIQRIRNLSSTIDKAYAEAARYYGFDCKGCDRNCCKEFFCHYTLAEYMFLMHGLALLEQEDKRALFRRAEEVKQWYRLHDAARQSERVMCPLNRNGFCVLYAYRPMICRLQGIPHLVKTPGQPLRRGPGCHVFNENIRMVPHADCGFDHTPFYTEMAAIEREIRNTLQYQDRYKKTVADMLVDIRDAEKCSEW